MAAGRLWGLSSLLCRSQRHNYKFGPKNSKHIVIDIIL